MSQPGGGRMVYSEEICLIGPGGAEAHFGALVRGLGIPGVPTATFWLDPALPASLLDARAPAGDRSAGRRHGGCLAPRQLDELERLAVRARPIPIADLGWLRLGGLRSLFAGLFDPPVGGAPLARANHLEVHHLAGCDASALLLVAWLGVLLDWRPLRCGQTSEGAALRVRARRRRQPRRHLAPADGPCGRSGILGRRAGGGSDRYASAATRSTKPASAPVAPAAAVKLDSYSDAELCVAALGPRGRDPLFARCLDYAGRLWALEPGAVVSRATRAAGQPTRTT